MLPSALKLPARIAMRAARIPLRQAQWAERFVLSALRARLEALDTTARPRIEARTGDMKRDGDLTELAARTMEELLAQSLDQSARDSQEQLYMKLLDDLVPDEARILASLSDGSAAALVHVETRIGEKRRSLENASSVGRGAGLTVPRLTPAYVTNLLRLGLVEIGPEASELKLEYETLMADRAVRRALTDAEVGPVPARVVRRTLRLSDLGRELWAACGSPRR